MKILPKQLPTPTSSVRLPLTHGPPSTLDDPILVIPSTTPLVMEMIDQRLPNPSQTRAQSPNANRKMPLSTHHPRPLPRLSPQHLVQCLSQHPPEFLPPQFHPLPRGQSPKRNN